MTAIYPTPMYIFGGRFGQPIWTGLAFGLSVFALYLGIELHSERPQHLLSGVAAHDAGCPYLLGDYRISFVTLVLLSYTISARALLTGLSRMSASELGAGPGRWVDAEALARRHLWGWLPGILGLAVAFAAALDIARQPLEWNFHYWIWPHLFNWVMCIPFGWTGGIFLYSVAMNSFLVYRLACRVRVHSLEDSAPQQDTLSRHGLRTALLTFIFAGILSVHFIDEGAGPFTIAFVTSIFLVGAALSVIPTLGLMRAYEQCREARMEELHREFEREEQALLHSTSGYTPGRMADLVALEQRLNQWQLRLFRLSNLMRFGVYAVLGLMSWLATTTVSTFIENMVMP